jgi:hypothetical protein
MSGRRRASGDLTLDLSHLDEATAAHEATVGALIAHLSRQGIEACTDLVRVRRVPRFPRVALDMDRWRARPWDFGRPADCLGRTVSHAPARSIGQTRRSGQLPVGANSVEGPSAFRPRLSPPHWVNAGGYHALAESSSRMPPPRKSRSGSGRSLRWCEILDHSRVFDCIAVLPSAPTAPVVGLGRSPNFAAPPTRR